jgi:hypothetical protein
MSIIPETLINHILSFRPTHPTANVIKLERARKEEELLMNVYYVWATTNVRLNTIIDNNNILIANGINNPLPNNVIDSINEHNLIRIHIQTALNMINEFRATLNLKPIQLTL